jgi:hypothetical protein
MVANGYRWWMFQDGTLGIELETLGQRIELFEFDAQEVFWAWLAKVWPIGTLPGIVIAAD